MPTLLPKRILILKYLNEDINKMHFEIYESFSFFSHLILSLFYLLDLDLTYLRVQTDQITIVIIII